MNKDEQLYAIIALIRPVFRAITTAVGDRLVGTGLGIAERGVLECLSAQGPISVAAMGRIIGVPRQFVQRTCNGLLDARYVEKIPNPAHARSDLIRLTHSGRQAFARLRTGETAASKRLAANLSSSDLAAAARVLRAMRQHYEGLHRRQR